MSPTPPSGNPAGATETAATLTHNTPELKHGAEPLYENADYCGHPQPPFPETLEADPEGMWDAWRDDHPNSVGDLSEPVCLLTPAGTFCPACTEVEREERDLPVDEYVTCLLAAEEGSIQ